MGTAKDNQYFVVRLGSKFSEEPTSLLWSWRQQTSLPTYMA